MADSKISALTTNSPLTGAEYTVLVQPAIEPRGNRKVTLSDIMTLAPVQRVNGNIGVVVLTATDVGAIAVGGNISLLTNDAGYTVGGIMTASNGLTKTGNNVALGGTNPLTANTTILGDDNDLTLGSYGTSQLFRLFVTTSNNITMTARGTGNIVINSEGASSTINLQSLSTFLTVNAIGSINLSAGSSSGTFTINTTETLFTDNKASKKGIEYAAANYVTGDRSLTDRGYVLGAKTFTGSQTLRTGSATAGTYPLRFISGTLLSSPVTGVEEFLTDKRYITITTSTARKEYTLNDAALTVNRIPFTTTNGRLKTSSNLIFDDDVEFTLSNIDIIDLSGTIVGIAASDNAVFSSSTGSLGLNVGGPGAQANVNIFTDTSVSLAGLQYNAQPTNPTAFTLMTKGYIDSVANATSGTYTPTLSNTTNITSSTAYTVQWIKVGNVVTVSGMVGIQATSAAYTVLNMSLLFASAFVNLEQCAGTHNQSSGTENAGVVYAATGLNNAEFAFQAVSTSLLNRLFTFTYLIL